jgi:hypothetical protein
MRGANGLEDKDRGLLIYIRALRNVDVSLRHEVLANVVDALAQFASRSHAHEADSERCFERFSEERRLIAD